MQTSLQIDFQDGQPNETLRRIVNGHISLLELIYDRLVGCRVTIKAPGRHHRPGEPYEVHIRLTLPDGAEINVGHLQNSNDRHSDVIFAINNAFRRACRQLQDRVRRLSAQMKIQEA